MKGVLVATGILGWDGAERRSDRYGVIHISRTSYNDDATSLLNINRSLLNEFSGKRVRTYCRVVETRTSGHCGDLFHGILPTTPDVNSEFDLGVSNLSVEDSWEADGVALSLRPDDNRSRLWLDPRILYQLHDQTLEVWLETTDDVCEPVPQLPTRAAGTRQVEDGVLQVKGNPKISPELESLGDGLFRLRPFVPYTKK